VNKAVGVLQAVNALLDNSNALLIDTDLEVETFVIQDALRDVCRIDKLIQDLVKGWKPSRFAWDKRRHKYMDTLVLISSVITILPTFLRAEAESDLNASQVSYYNSQVLRLTPVGRSLLPPFGVLRHGLTLLISVYPELWVVNKASSITLLMSKLSWRPPRIFRKHHIVQIHRKLL